MHALGNETARYYPSVEQAQWQIIHARHTPRGVVAESQIWGVKVVHVVG